MVTPAGFEPATCPLGGGCSIQLSHGAIQPILVTGGSTINANLKGLHLGYQADASALSHAPS